ncbi:hypothetical protein HAX54_044113, partial [Datura stramonium]|nr:hypothetical protein [Datura stramonium]
ALEAFAASHLPKLCHQCRVACATTPRRKCLMPVLEPDLLAPYDSQGTAMLLLRTTGCAEVLAPRAAGRAGVAALALFFALKS